MMNISINVSGAKELAAIFDRLPDELREQLADKVNEFAQEVVSRSVGTAPIFRGVLVKSIRVAKRATKSDPNARVGTASHGPLVELGHKIVGRKTGRIYGFVAGKPFMRPVVDSMKERYRAGMLAAFNQAISDSIKSGGIKIL